MGKIKTQAFITISLICFVSSCQQEVTLPPKPPQRSIIFNNYLNNKVDLLMVIGDTGGTFGRQAELSNGIDSFVSACLAFKADLQIAVIPPNMNQPFLRGRFQARNMSTPKIMKSSQLTKENLASFLKLAIDQGHSGPLAQMTFEVIKQALSPELLAQENKGFLRPHSLLVVLMMNYRDDCSHDPKIVGELVNYTQCYLPKSVTHEGEKGIMEYLYPVSKYIDFLKGFELQYHRTMVTGIIGEPTLKQKTTLCTVPSESCAKPNQSTTCMYQTPLSLTCGGCQDSEGRAYPGFRYHKLIKSISGSGYSFSICAQNSNKFHIQKAMLDITTLINEHLRYIVLKKPITQINQAKVFFHRQGTTKVSVPYAPQTKQSCKKDTDCKENSVCGNDLFCYGDGWVYFPAKGRFQPKIKISGNYKIMLTSTTRILVQTQE